jgi:membrane protein YqaA with SNARE-associated domain
MTDFIFSLGYFGLFLISFLSASLLPLASEVVVIGMPPLGYSVWAVIVVATVGSYCGSLVNYTIGKKGTDFVLGRYIKIDSKTWDRAERFYKRWGPVALFFSWVPFIGDPLTAVAGALNMHLGVFSFWVLFGKTLRYLVLLGIASRFLDMF